MRYKFGKDWQRILLTAGAALAVAVSVAGTAFASQTAEVNFTSPQETVSGAQQDNTGTQVQSPGSTGAQTQAPQQGGAGAQGPGVPEDQTVMQGPSDTPEKPAGVGPGYSQGTGSNTSAPAAGGTGTYGPSVSGGSGAAGQPAGGPSVYSGGVPGVLPQENLLGGATLTMLNSQTESQMLSLILQTRQGSLIVVDGGLGADAAYLRSQLQARGGHVAAWLITHPHGDHVGALYQILQDQAAGVASGLQIDGIYYSFAAPDWYTVHDPEEVTMAHSIISVFSWMPPEVMHSVSRGQTIQIDDVTIQVMNDRYELGSDKGNNASIVYKLWVNGKSILILGDMGEEGGNRLLAELGTEGLKSDIVQMAHHGQNGVSEAVYQAIDPSICLWPSPAWLWNNEGGRYRISETKSWMSRLNVQKHYCMKDGDQIIQ